MNSTMRNLTLTAAALAALTVIAPKASADERERDRQGSRQEVRHDDHGGWHGHESHEHFRYAPHPVYRYGYGYYAPYRVYSGYRFYPYSPGPGYVYIAGFGWVFPPFFGAVWVPAHYDIGGFWVEGTWR